MDVEIKNDYAGAHVALKFDNTKTNGQDVSLDTKYWGWMKFGDFTLTAGKFESLFTKKGNTTVVEEGLTDSDPAKSYGLSNMLMANNKAIGKGFMYDANTISAVAGTRNLSVFADYTFADVAGGKLLLKAGVVDGATSGEYRTDAGYDGNGGTRKVGTGFSFDAALQREDFSVEGMIRTTSYYNVVAGLYASLDMVDKTPIKLGFTWGSQSKTNAGAYIGLADATTALAAKDWASKVAYDAWAIDWRITNKSVDKVTLVLNGKYETLTPKYDGADAETGLYIVGQVGYEMSDLINLALSAGIYYCDLDDNDKKDQGENYIQVQPAVEFKAGKGAKFTTALLYKQALNTGDCADNFNDKTISIPCIFRVKM